jgi:hypothetical protein
VTNADGSKTELACSKGTSSPDAGTKPTDAGTKG